MGRRIHRRGADKKCKGIFNDGTTCNDINTLEYCIFQYSVINDCGEGIRKVVSRITGGGVGETQLLCLSFNCPQKKQTKSLSLVLC